MAVPRTGLRGRVRGNATPSMRSLRETGNTMDLTLTIGGRTLKFELDDVVAGLLAARLNLPAGTDTREAIREHLSEAGSPWMLDESHMRRRIMRRLILDIADPALIVRYLMAEQPQ